ncbi:acyltransferase [Thalassotalea fonticola]|uniref:Acyltransferase n=1 Tax=Thalassotalea fonticola TaxID=3065649 RepID=A0ABZ0GSP5_9GAMM|nr:acyltransferase [Colwelliaceae bacterium S1-1]
MAYFNNEQLENMGFKYVGKDVKISDKASIYDPDKISIGDYSRIDDFCIVSGKVNIGKFVHITPMCLIAGGEPGVELSDFSTLAYGVKIFSQTDDYSGETMVNSLIDPCFKKEIFAPVKISKHVIVGSNAVVFPGVTIEEGCSIGSMTLVHKTTKPWGIYVGIPSRRLKERKKDLLELESRFLKSIK